jgi:hypothetical protein
MLCRTVHDSHRLHSLSSHGEVPQQPPPLQLQTNTFLAPVLRCIINRLYGSCMMVLKTSSSLSVHQCWVCDFAGHTGALSARASLHLLGQPNTLLAPPLLTRRGPPAAPPAPPWLKQERGEEEEHNEPIRILRL